MTLRLSVPQSYDEAETAIKTEPALLRDWLDQMPLLDSSGAAEQLYQAIKTTNRVALHPDVRLELLELYREKIELVSQALSKLYTGLNQVLTERHKSMAEQVRQFDVELASGYKRIILDITEAKRGRLKHKHGLKLALPIQRAIRHLSATLVHAYEFYMPYPVGTLREIHELYHFAEELAIGNLPIAEPLNNTLPQSSINHIYQQALLLDLSDPYHLPNHMIQKVQHYLDRWASLAEIGPVKNEPKDSCQFVIDLHSDRAGKAYTSPSSGTLADHHRLLTTLELARSMHTQLALMKQGKTPSHDGLGADFFNPSVKDMLVRLINTWGINPKRIFPRNTQSGGQLQLVLGLAAINFFINDEHRFVTSAKQLGPKQPGKNDSTLFLDQVPTAAHHNPRERRRAEDLRKPPVATTWFILDESAGGLALQTRTQENLDIKVGDLVATHMPQSNHDWNIGIVRWMKYPGPGQIELGIQRLAPRARPAAIKILRKAGDNELESDFLYALILPELPALKQRQTLIVPRGTYQNDQMIYLDDGTTIQRVSSARLLEVTGSFERFEYGLNQSA